ncbi:hypothetical protein Tco_0877763 [Tanacetum coccineum]|uniref:Uncharacterized protein n=1 Tax=Tanacetum coccineum TaxID=301880 RepID=A0ABQ5BYI3_9ASTR
MEHDQLLTKFNVGAARQMFLSAEVRMRAEYNVKEKRRLKSVVKSQGELLKVREEEIESLKAQLLLREAEAVEAIHLRVKASKFETVEKSLRDEMNTLRERNIILEKERNALDVKVMELETSVVSKERELTNLNALKVTVYENCMDQLERFQDDRMKVVNDKFDKLYTEFVEMALHLEEKFYPHLLTTISGSRWLLTQGMKLAIIKCLNLPEYLFALGVAISKAIEKELKSNKDASIEAVMNILHLEEPLAEKLGLDELQPNLDQLMVPIHHSPNKVVIGATALSLALDISNDRPLSIAVLIGTKGTSNVVSATGGATTDLSTTFSFASTIAPIYVDDYKVIDVEDQAAADGNAASFPIVDDAELNIVQSPGLKFALRTLELQYFSIFALLFALRIAACSLFYSKRSRLISKASSFCTKSISAVLIVGMPIFAGITAFVPYVNKNRVSLLLDFIMAIGLGMFDRSKVLVDA